MAVFTTSIGLSTTPSILIGVATTWADIAGAHIQDTVPFVAFNETTAIPVRISGSSSTAATGMPLFNGSYYVADLMRTDELWGFTTASTATITVQAGRQLGG